MYDGSVPTHTTFVPLATILLQQAHVYECETLIQCKKRFILSLYHLAAPLYLLKGALDIHAIIFCQGVDEISSIPVPLIVK